MSWSFQDLIFKHCKVCSEEFLFYVVVVPMLKYSIYWFLLNPHNFSSHISTFAVRNPISTWYNIWESQSMTLVIVLGLTLQSCPMHVHINVWLGSKDSLFGIQAFFFFFFFLHSSFFFSILSHKFENTNLSFQFRDINIISFGSLAPKPWSGVIML